MFGLLAAVPVGREPPHIHQVDVLAVRPPVLVAEGPHPEFLAIDHGVDLHDRGAEDLRRVGFHQNTAMDKMAFGACQRDDSVAVQGLGAPGAKPIWGS